MRWRIFLGDDETPLRDGNVCSSDGYANQTDCNAASTDGYANQTDCNSSQNDTIETDEIIITAK